MSLAFHIDFNGQCEEAFSFYAENLGGTIGTMLRFEDSPVAESTESDGRKIVHANICIDGVELAGADVEPEKYERPKGFYVLLGVDSEEKVRSFFNALQTGGHVVLEPQKTFWSPCYAIVVDRFASPGRSTLGPDQSFKPTLSAFAVSQAALPHEGESSYSYDFDNHLFELHTGTLEHGSTQASGPMKRDLEQPSRVGPIAAILVAVMLLSVYVAWHLPSGSPVIHSGVVQTSGSISASRIKGGTREAALVLLGDGTLVTAYVVSGGALSAGDNVRVLEQRALLGPSAFQVVAKESGQ